MPPLDIEPLNLSSYFYYLGSGLSFFIPRLTNIRTSTYIYTYNRPLSLILFSRKDGLVD